MNTTASELLATADAVTQLAQRLDAITQLAATIGKIGVVTQAADEADARIAKAQAELADLQKQKAVLAEDIAAADRSRDNTLVKAAAEADRLVTTAKATAEGTVYRASKAAEDAAQKITDEAAAKVAAFEAQAEKLVEDIAAANAILASTQEQQVVAAADLEATNQKIADARAAIAKALG